MTYIQAIILAGGESKRMGSDKGLMTQQGKPFVQTVIEAAKAVTSRIMIISNNDDYKRFGYPVYHDIIPDKGPAGGIYTGLCNSKYDANLVLSCDIPFAETSLISVLVSRFGKEDALFYSEGKNQHPLIGVYRRSLKDHFEKCLKSNKLKLTDILESVNVKTLEVPEPMKHQLRNINTKEDYNKYIHEA